MSAKTLTIFILASTLGIGLFFTLNKNISISIAQDDLPQQDIAPAKQEITESDFSVKLDNNEKEPSPLIAPIDRAMERITKKPLGILISPDNSPVYPEVFTGYHSGVDFETFANEQEIAVPITAICNGPLRNKMWAKGYGGVAVQDCLLNNEAITVIYGHLNLDSVIANPKEEIKQGDFVGLLGQAFSTETDNRRKHLHLGIHQGNGPSILGYVPQEKDLAEWLDITSYLN